MQLLYHWGKVEKTEQENDTKVLLQIDAHLWKHKGRTEILITGKTKSFFLGTLLCSLAAVNWLCLWPPELLISNHL